MHRIVALARVMTFSFRSGQIDSAAWLVTASDDADCEVVGKLILPAVFHTFKLRTVTPAAVTEKNGSRLPDSFERNPNRNAVAATRTLEARGKPQKKRGESSSTRPLKSVKA